MQGHYLNEEHRNALLQPFTDEYIRRAMFRINSNKSLGPHGCGSGFFKHTWSIIGYDVSCAIKYFFANGKLLRQLMQRH